MAVKKIIDIEVNDGAFARFQALFQKYQDQLKKTPQIWKDVGAEVDAVLDQTAEGAEKVVDEVDGIAGSAQKANVHFRQTYLLINNQSQVTNNLARSQKVAAVAAVAQASAWRGMARTSKTFAGNVVDATRSLLRWSALTGVLSGLLGAGGLFGISRLAAAAGGARRSSLGLGVTAGEQSAFSLNYGRVVDPDRLLGGVNESLTDVTKRSALYGAGLSERDLKGKDTASVAAELIPALKKLADQTPAALLAQTLRSRQLDQFISPQDFQRLKNTPAAEIEGYGKKYREDAEKLNIPDPQLKAWQDLQVQLNRAGEQIEKTFIDGLTPLAPQIGRISEGFSNLVEALLKSPKVKEWMDLLADSLSKFADYIGKPEFEADVKSFVTGVGEMAAAIWKAINKIRQFFGGGDSQTPEEKSDAKKAWDEEEARRRARQDEWDRAHGRDPDKPSPSFALPWGGSKSMPRQSSPVAPQSALPGGAADASGMPSYSPIAFRPGSFSAGGGVSPALLASVEYQESRGRDVTNKTSGAAGYFQFMPGTAKQYGVDVHNEASSADGARRYLTDLKDQFGGSIEKALAAYNWGPGNLQKDIKTYGEGWRDHLPDETKRYVGDILGRLGAPATERPRSTIDVRIQNNTGGNAIVAASQLAA